MDQPYGKSYFGKDIFSRSCWNFTTSDLTLAARWKGVQTVTPAVTSEKCRHQVGWAMDSMRTQDQGESTV